MKFSLAATATVAGLAAGVAVVAMPTSASADPDIPLYDNMGDYSRTITTEVKQAQAYFDQGLRLAYGFAQAQAAKSFQAAQGHDPKCAMCYWGEAWALGPYQNNPDGVGAPEDVQAAAQRALDLAQDARPWEQSVIGAMAERVADSAAGNGGPWGTEAYAEAMKQAAVDHPEDLDVRVLHAEALMMHRPWNLYRDDGSPYPETQTAITELEAVLDRDIEHPGACHLYIHAVESFEPHRAEACADRLAAQIPGISHIQHMPSHIYLNIGRYGDGVRANKKARIMDQAAQHGEGVSVYAPHNTLMLVNAAWLDGQSGVALSAARDIARERPEDTFHTYLQLARFGRWEELLEPDTEPKEPLQAGMWHFARGLAQLRMADPEAADAALAAVRKVRGDTPEDAVYHFFRHSQRDLLGIAENILAGEIAASEGRIDNAEEYLREATMLEDGLPYSEPEPWPIPARHVLGAVLLEADRAEAAEAVYRESLKVHPNNGWSLKGLTQSLKDQRKDAEAAEAEEAFERAWQRADIWLPGSRF